MTKRKRLGGQANRSAQSIIAKLSGMEIGQLIGIWNSAVKRLATDKHPEWRRAARQILPHVEAEWTKRKNDFSREDFFTWPTTEAIGGDSSLSLIGTPNIGMLGYLGYHVGRLNGLPDHVRQELLIKIFAMNLPPVISPSYVGEWGAPGSAARLKKMAESIAAFTRNLKRRDGVEFEQAIAEWESDLNFLHVRLYRGKFGFGWPFSSI
jgi:hypothetical protein